MLPSAQDALGCNPILPGLTPPGAHQAVQIGKAMQPEMLDFSAQTLPWLLEIGKVAEVGAFSPESRRILPKA